MVKRELAIQVHPCVCMYAPMCVYVCTHVRVCMHPCICMYAPMCVYVCTHVYTGAPMCIQVHPCVCMYVYIYVHVHIYIHSYVYVHVNVYLHTVTHYIILCSVYVFTFLYLGVPGIENTFYMTREHILLRFYTWAYHEMGPTCVCV